MKLVTEETLRELYWECGYTLAQVGEFFGHKGTWAARQMDKYGISRRAGGHTRKLPGCETLRRLYVDEGKGLREIADIYGTDASSVGKHLKKCGVERRPVGRIPICIENLQEMYERKSGPAIAKELGMNLLTVYRAMDRQGVDRDGHHIGRALPIHPFFLQEAPEKYYVLGFLFADGNISDQWQVTLAQSNRAILDKIAHLVDREVNPKKKTNWLVLGGKSLALHLKKNYGVGPRKSNVMPWPDIPEGYLPDFIRGFFDGDGSVGISKEYSRWVSFTCGSIDFITGLRDKLDTAGFGRQKIYPVKGKGSAYRILYFGKFRLGRMFDYLYYPECLCMQTKLDKFEMVTGKRLGVEQLELSM